MPKDDLALRGKAKDRWYVPDSNKAGDLEKLRERALLREFDEYLESKPKRLQGFPVRSRARRFQESLAGTQLPNHHRCGSQGSRKGSPRGPQTPHVV